MALTREMRRKLERNLPSDALEFLTEELQKAEENDKKVKELERQVDHLCWEIEKHLGSSGQGQGMGFMPPQQNYRPNYNRRPDPATFRYNGNGPQYARGYPGTGKPRYEYEDDNYDAPNNPRDHYWPTYPTYPIAPNVVPPRNDGGSGGSGSGGSGGGGGS